MKSIFRMRVDLCWLVALMLTLTPGLIHAQSISGDTRHYGSPVSLAGMFHYQTSTDTQAGMILNLIVYPPDNGRCVVSFSGGYLRNNEVHPVGISMGKLNADGALRFDYKNEGTGTVWPAEHGGCRILIKLKRIVEPKCKVFYNEWFLYRTETLPATSVTCG